MKKKLLLFLLMPIFTLSQVQIGQKIEGDSKIDAFGTSVAVSTDGTVIAVGAPFNAPSKVPGYVRVYKNVSGVWTQIGDDIKGAAQSGQWGSSIALSANGAILAAGAPYYNGKAGWVTGHVRVFEYISGKWTQVGDDIEGEAELDYSGNSIALSDDGKILAIGAAESSMNSSHAGQVRVFENIGGTWSQIGQSLTGLSQGDGLGKSVALSADGKILAAGANTLLTATANSNYTILYENITGNWTQIGQLIKGSPSHNRSGYSVSLSDDGSIVAIGAPRGYGERGQVIVYQNIAGLWTPKGSPIDGENNGDNSGGSVSLSSNGNIVAIGAVGNRANGNHSGHARVYEYKANNWTQVGNDMDGEQSISNEDYFGNSVALSGAGDKLIIGAPVSVRYSSSTKNSYAKVYDLTGLLSSVAFNKVGFSVYPNPVTNILHIEVEKTAAIYKIAIYNSMGQKVKTTSENRIDVTTLSKGIYFIEVVTSQGKATQKFIVK